LAPFDSYVRKITKMFLLKGTIRSMSYVLVGYNELVPLIRDAHKWKKWLQPRNIEHG
jgi:hypothetical protein